MECKQVMIKHVYMAFHFSIYHRYPNVGFVWMFIVLPNQTNFQDFIFWIYLSLQLIRILQNIFFCTHTWYVCIFKCFSWWIRLSCCYTLYTCIRYINRVYPRIILHQTGWDSREKIVDDIFSKYRVRLKSL